MSDEERRPRVDIDHRPDAEPSTSDRHDVDTGPVVDARGMACPMPVLELAKAIEQVAVGEHVTLLATDPAAKVDVPVWCRMQRQRLRAQHLDDHVWTFEVERVR